MFLYCVCVYKQEERNSGDFVENIKKYKRITSCAIYTTRTRLRFFYVGSLLLLSVNQRKSPLYFVCLAQFHHLNIITILYTHTDMTEYIQFERTTTTQLYNNIQIHFFSLYFLIGCCMLMHMMSEKPDIVIFKFC